MCRRRSCSRSRGPLAERRGLRVCCRRGCGGCRGSESRGKLLDKLKKTVDGFLLASAQCKQCPPHNPSHNAVHEAWRTFFAGNRLDSNKGSNTPLAPTRAPVKAGDIKNAPQE